MKVQSQRQEGFSARTRPGLFEPHVTVSGRMDVDLRAVSKQDSVWKCVGRFETSRFSKQLSRLKQVSCFATNTLFRNDRSIPIQDLVSKRPVYFVHDISQQVRQSAEIVRTVGCPISVGFDSFGTPHFFLMADLLKWHHDIMLWIF
jgi:hypothetical protein